MAAKNALDSGLFVPFSIQEQATLTSAAKLVLSQIAAFKDCRLTNDELGERLALTGKTVGGILTALRGAGLLTTLRKEGRRVLSCNLTTSNRGSWLPMEAATAAELSPTDKLLIANVASLSNCKKGCIASNWHLARVAGVTVQRVKDILTKLRAFGWVTSIMEAGKRVLKYAKELAAHLQKKTCTAPKQDAPHKYQNKDKTLLAAAENPISLNDKISNVISSTAWLKSQIVAKGLELGEVVAGVAGSGFAWLSENAARAYVKDWLGRKDASAAVIAHPAAAPICDRWQEYFKTSISAPQLAKLCEAADKYGVNKVRYIINVIGANGNSFHFTTAAVLAELQKNYK